ncbi:MAG: hypothetical protein OZ948_11915 [Deltaproteobacteria bacterium]|nr:hypothetical protein [Deltaproteobacteria bacterium]
MRGVRSNGFVDRVRAGLVAAGLAVGGLLAVAAPAGAFEYFDGRLQVHGFFEEQIRMMSDDFHINEDFDLAQWYHVLSIETEYDFAPDGWGPFDVLSSYMRLEARYDCVWTRACGMVSSADAWGNRARRLPRYRTSGNKSGMSGAAYIGNFIDGPFNPRSDVGKYTATRPWPTLDRRYTVGGQPLTHPVIAEQIPEHNRRPARIDQIPGFSGLFVVRGQNAIFERGGDDPAYFYFHDQLKCKFGVRHVPAGENGVGFQIIGPVNPECEPDNIGALRTRPNPFLSTDINPIVLIDPTNPALGNAGGSAELPARPAAMRGWLDGEGGRTESQGVFYPSAGFQRWNEKTRSLDNPRQNFSQNELAWNHGDTQSWEKELKELYVDMEFFDSQLWVRAGRQSIVWGKTELFRTTDQFNPVDLALASLPSLEESRVAVWSARAVWSFYDVGPAEDVRVEVAANFDQFKPNDTGRCGEPFTALVACNKTFALWLHGLAGFALAGEDRPDDPWQDIEGLEFGGRVEWRMGRFSFQVSDFYGFEDLPYVEQIMTFERRVDPVSGRPLRWNSRDACRTGLEQACLPIRSNLSLGVADPNPNTDGSLPPGVPVADPANRGPLLEAYGSNMQLFAMICATSIGFNALDPSACGQSVFNSNADLAAAAAGLTVRVPRSMAKTTPTIASGLSNALSGGNLLADAVIASLAGVPAPMVRLNVDPCDDQLANPDYSPGAPCSGVTGRTPHAAFAPVGVTLNQVLTDEQEALLGCGPFWGTDCEGDGIDLLNADAGVLQQSWVGFEGAYTEAYRNGGFVGWHLANGEAQPGTIGFFARGASLPAARYVDGGLVQVNGADGPFLADGVTPNPHYDVNRDGSTAGLVIPPQFGASAGQQFASEMAALSFNYQLLLVAFSSAEDGATTSEKDEFDPANPYAYFDPANPATAAFEGQCSFIQPQYCSAIQSLYDITGVQRNTVKAGGHDGYGRRDFVWHSGAEGVLRYNKRNVLGFSFDFAEDVTKTNWGAEMTWIEGQKFSDNDEFDGITESDTLNFTVSVDRPTFINFLNQNRTFFFNSQFFFQYITNYKDGFPGNGPFNILGTFTVQTGYYQDRLLPGVTFVYDRRSNSGAALPSLTYRFTENFSGTVGLNFFFGRWQTVDMPIQGLGTVGGESGKLAYQESVENGLAVVRERDEFYMRLRYTF